VVVSVEQTGYELQPVDLDDAAGAAAASLLPVLPEALVRLGFAVFAAAQRVQAFGSAGAPVLAPEDWALAFGVRQAQGLSLCFFPSPLPVSLERA
jgi:hypothetical protein